MSVDDSLPAPPPEPAATGPARSVGLGLAIGTVVTFAMAMLTWSVFAFPAYLFATFDPAGLDRPAIRRVFFVVAIPAGLVVGTGAGAIVGRWYARGGRLPVDRTPWHER